MPKIVDDYDAKLKFWARNPKVYPALKLRHIPGFTSRKFNSYEELAAWKKSVLDGFVARGESPWIK